MKRKEASPSRANVLSSREIKREKIEKNIELFLLFLTLVSTSAFLILFTSHYIATGYATFIDSQAGTVTKVVIERTFPTTFWNGVYGLAIRVPGFSEQLSINLNNEISRQDVFFDCIDTSDEHADEVYASTSETIDFSTITPATTAEVDAYMGCSGREDCASGTFTNTMSVMLGTTNITNIPSTHTYRYDGQNDIFEVGILKDGDGNLIYVSKIANVQRGYSPNVTVNYQFLLPTPELASNTFYFFNDPYDVCPAGGGIGDTIDASIHGYAKDSFGNPVENATISIFGITVLTNPSGFYNISLEVIEGVYSVIAQKTGYKDVFENVNISYTNTSIQQNITMELETPSTDEVITTNIDGYVTDAANQPIYEANVSIGGYSDQTDLFGYYSIFPSVTPRNHSIIAIKEGYNNNHTLIDFTAAPPYVSVNMTLQEVVAQEDTFAFATGPFSENLISDILEEAKKNGEDYWVSTKDIDEEIRRNTFKERAIGIYNFGSPMNLEFELSSSLSGIVELETLSLSIPANSFGEIPLVIYGTENLGEYTGNLTIRGDLDQEIPIKITIVERLMPIEALLIRAEVFDDIVYPSEDLRYKLTLQNLLSDQGYIVNIETRVKDKNSSTIYAKKEIREEIVSSLTILDEITIPEEIPIGEYNLEITAKYLNYATRVISPFRVSQPLYLYAFFGIPLWIYMALISFMSFILLNLFIYKRHMDKKKRYSVKVDFATLPGPGERTATLGHIAETKKNAYYELDKLTVHTVVAGATGMGKSISAQVLIEEALMNNICVIVFDPTAQWSGMLRKCEDKKMLSFYPKFGMKPNQARGFPGNIRAIKDARQVVDINKYFEPGHIQIFTLNKLQPKDMDIFVAGVIRQIFKSDPKESPNLKTLLVFDEVHRLLPKFGGSGEGFLQIERGCREFRKWGLGQILISQVMNDFVGEIKANINTEIQARTVEEGDLERIRSKYGEGYLKSLVKSEIGVSMFQNAEYNKGLPYFINFRPILHNTRRLSDEELEKYNKYNDDVDELEYQVEQLEEEKVDVFDLKMELKLVKDKIMVGNFSVVDIYLEGLKPRLQKQWEKLGKTPKKKQVELADLDEIKKSVEEAKKEKESIQKKEDSNAAAKKEESKQENLDDKQVEALTLDNGAMLSSLGELKDLLPGLDDEIFKAHVNEEKNDIAKWLEKVSPELGSRAAAIKEKAGLVELLKTTDKK